MNTLPLYTALASAVHRLPKINGLWPFYLRFLLHGNERSFHIHTHLTEAERLVLYQLAVQLPKGSCIVEIGSYLGASSCFLAAAAIERRARLYCIDTWQNDAMTEGKRDTYGEFLFNTRRYRRAISPIRQRSEDAAAEFNQGIDLLFVDADHQYEAVVADLRCWLPKVRSGAWLILHDWGWAPGVQQVITEMVLPIQVSPPKTLPNLYAARIKTGNGRVH